MEAIIIRNRCTLLRRKPAMYVCLCNAITDRQIQDTVAAGASSLGDLQAQLGVATCCGCCADLATSFISAHQHQQINATAGAAQ